MLCGAFSVLNYRCYDSWMLMEARKAHRKTCAVSGYRAVLPKRSPRLIGCRFLPTWLCLNHLEALASQILPIASVA